MQIHAYGTPRDLPESLRHHVRVLPGSSFQSFHHPFLVDILPLGLPAPIEEILQAREDQAWAQLEKGAVASYIFRHERPYRMTELLRLVRGGYFDGSLRSSVRYWRLLASVWMDAEEDEASLLWGLLLAARLPARGAMTSSADRRALRAMPARLALYRGLQAEDEDAALDAACVGYSWTLSHATAGFFAQRHLRPDQSAWIARTQIDRDQVIAYLTRRGEAEILVESAELDASKIEVESLPVHRPQSPELITLQAFFVE